MRAPDTGAALLLGGALLFSFAGGRYAWGAWQATEARQQYEADQAVSLVRAARASLDRGLPIQAPAGAPVARLLIPDIGLDEIVLEGVDDESLNAGPGHLPGSPLPGQRGNAVISAHRDRHFARLGEVEVGDTITTEVALRRQRWVVVGRRVVGEQAPALFRTNEPALTLTTCWPIRYFGPAPERLILTARPLRF